MLSSLDYVLLSLAAMAAGMVNALAGGGTLITFPALNALGLPLLTANIVNTVALAPGYFGGALAQRRDLEGQRRRLWLVIPAGVLGGVIGAHVFLATGEKLFRDLVPFLILLGSILLAVQKPVRAFLLRRSNDASARLPEAWVMLPLVGASVYGGYFGAGLSVIVLAVLALILEDTLTRLNALKQMASLSVNTAAAIYLILSPRVEWSVPLIAAVVLMAVSSLVGGALGGKLAGRIDPERLRWLIVGIGVAVATGYFLL